MKVYFMRKTQEYFSYDYIKLLKEEKICFNLKTYLQNTLTLTIWTGLTRRDNCLWSINVFFVTLNNDIKLQTIGTSL